MIPRNKYLCALSILAVDSVYSPSRSRQTVKRFWEVPTTDSCTYSIPSETKGLYRYSISDLPFSNRFDSTSLHCLRQIQAHEYDINSVAFADDSSHIIYSGGDDGLLKVWDRRMLGEERTPTPVGVLAGHRDGITYICPRGDSRYLISNSKDQSIKLWDVRVFSSQSAVQSTMRAVYEQTWDYRWQGVPTKRKIK